MVVAFAQNGAHPGDAASHTNGVVDVDAPAIAVAAAAGGDVPYGLAGSKSFVVGGKTQAVSIHPTIRWLAIVTLVAVALILTDAHAAGIYDGRAVRRGELMAERTRGAAFGFTHHAIGKSGPTGVVAGAEGISRAVGVAQALDTAPLGSQTVMFGNCLAVAIGETLHAAAGVVLGIAQRPFLGTIAIVVAFAGKTAVAAAMITALAIAVLQAFDAVVIRRTEGRGRGALVVAAAAGLLDLALMIGADLPLLAVVARHTLETLTGLGVAMGGGSGALAVGGAAGLNAGLVAANLRRRTIQAAQAFDAHAPVGVAPGLTTAAMTVVYAIQAHPVSRVTDGRGGGTVPVLDAAAAAGTRNALQPVRALLILATLHAAAGHAEPAVAFTVGGTRSHNLATSRLTAGAAPAIAVGVTAKRLAYSGQTLS